MDLLELARAHIEAENKHDVDLTMSTVADDAFYNIYPTGQEIRGTENLRKFYADSFEAMPDLYIEIGHMMKDEEQREVMAQYTITGTDKGHLQGLAPTNRRIKYNGVVLYKFNEAGKLLSEITYFEKDEVLTTMGLIRNTKTNLGLILLIIPQSPIFTLRTIFYNLFHRSDANSAKR